MKRVLQCLAIVSLLWLGSLPVLRAQSAGEPQALFQKVMDFTLQNNYAGLMALCDQGMRDMVSAEMLTDLNRSLMVRFRTGYTPTYMGFLDKQGAKVYYWKVVLKDRGDDMLMTLVVRQNMVSAFTLK